MTSSPHPAPWKNGERLRLELYFPDLCRSLIFAGTLINKLLTVQL